MSLTLLAELHSVAYVGVFIAFIPDILSGLSTIMPKEVSTFAKLSNCYIRSLRILSEIEYASCLLLYSPSVCPKFYLKKILNVKSISLEFISSSRPTTTCLSFPNCVLQCIIYFSFLRF